MTMQDEIFQQVLRFVQEVLCVPMRYTHYTTSTIRWDAEMVVESCPFCTLPNGCGVWYGIWSGFADWMSHRPHPKLQIDKGILPTRPTDNWHYIRIKDI